MSKLSFPLRAGPSPSPLATPGFHHVGFVARDADRILRFCDGLLGLRSLDWRGRRRCPDRPLREDAGGCGAGRRQEGAIRRRIREPASPHHVPRVILSVPDIPRTISGKISEIAVREVIHGRPVKNTDALRRR